MTSTPARILHCHASFGSGQPARIAVQVMNGLGRKVEHVVISDNANDIAARALIDKRVTARFPTSFPALTERPTPGSLATIAQALKGYDLICTYGIGAINVTLAHTVFAENLGLPRLIHHETGTDMSDPRERKLSRNWHRRIALGRAAALVVPSRQLEQIALDKWKQPRARVQRIAPGIDTRAFARKPKPSALRVVKREGEQWVGAIADMQPYEKLPALIEAFKGLPEHWQIVILGEGPAQADIRQAAAKHKVEHRVHLPGATGDHASVMGLFDIFALGVQDGRFPTSVIKAMAAGLPVAAPETGELRAVLADENHHCLTPPGDTAALAHSLEALAGDPETREQAGAANMAKAKAEFGEDAMVECYRALYSEVMGRKI